ncbi:DUF4435 domain-containing protein [Burkholderia gladioli]|nr:DUF4435 domain-containing protein [Burkholderia gladioli]
MQTDEWLSPSADDLLTEAAMLAQSGAAAIVYVEGNTDARLLEGIFIKDIKIIPAGNCNAVEAVVEKYDLLTDPANLPHILGFADRDYKAANGGLKSSANIIYTHLRDIECVMLSTQAKFHMIGEYANQNFNRKWKKIDDFMDEAIKVARTVAIIRIWSEINKKGINFKTLDFDKFHAPKSNATDPEKLVTHLRGAQKSGNILSESYNKIKEKINDPLIMNHLAHDLLFCRGHDILEVVALYFKKGFGRSGLSYCGELLESALRIGAKPLLKNTDTFKLIGTWFTERGISNVFA